MQTNLRYYSRWGTYRRSTSLPNLLRQALKIPLELIKRNALLRFLIIMTELYRNKDIVLIVGFSHETQEISPVAIADEGDGSGAVVAQVLPLRVLRQER